MLYLIIIIKLIIGLGILNVWLVRSNNASQWRGGDAKNMKEEFDAYGLPDWSVKVVGALKVLLAVLLLASIAYEPLEFIAAAGIAALMAGAVAMHVKIGDELKKSLPALSLLALCLIILIW